MQDIVIKYTKNRRRETIKINVPTKWDELNQRQVLYIAKMWQVWQTLSESGDSLTVAKTKLFIELSGLSYLNKIKLCNALAFYNEKSGPSPLTATDFIFEKIDLSKNHFPTINVGWFRKLRGPSDAMGDCTIEEFAFAFSLYSKFSRTDKAENLNSLFAVLYRLESRNGIRKPFIVDDIKMYEKLAIKVPDEYKHACFLFFTGVLTYLELRFSEVFKRAQQKNVSSGNFIDTVVAMSGGKFGAFEIAKTTNMWVFLKELNEELIRQKNK